MTIPCFFAVLVAGMLLAACKQTEPAQQNSRPATSPAASGFGTVPSIRAEAPAVRESDSYAEVSLHLVPKMYQQIYVDYMTVDGSAVAGRDFEYTKGRLAFKPGEIRKTIRIPILQDAEREDAETLTIELNADGAQLDTPVLVVTIHADP